VGSLEAREERFPIRGTFRIARGDKSEAVVVVVEARDGDMVGRGEAVPYARYGESVSSVLDAIASLDASMLISREALGRALPAGAARSAVESALFELEARRGGRRVWEIAGAAPPRPIATLRTISIDAPEAMGRAAAALGALHLKVKVNGEREDVARVEAVRRTAPNAVIVVDPNESWTLEMLARVGPEMARLGVAMVEQPVPADADEGLAHLSIDGLTICADEAIHTRADLHARRGRYGAINVKVDKAGGLTEALALCREARAESLLVMVGCMVSTSLSIAPAFVLSGEADVFDLDGPLLLERDREGGAEVRNGMLHPPTLWRL
jgi:L-alanine-DL-glutamate epimerase-like enolase superfamily enzyme